MLRRWAIYYLASVLRALGELAAARGHLADAEACFDESLSRAWGVKDPWASGRAMVSQAMLADQRNERHLARALGRDALALQLQIGDQLGAVESLERLDRDPRRRCGSECAPPRRGNRAAQTAQHAPSLMAAQQPARSRRCGAPRPRRLTLRS
jgi:hypothetical protein